MEPIGSEWLPRGHIKTQNMRLWAEEAIWGHRFYDDQTPWLVILEFLNVFVDRHRRGMALKEEFHSGKHEVFSYNMRRVAPMRYIVFGNPFLREAALLSQNEEKWAFWLESVKNNVTGEDYSYVRERVPDYDTFYTAVNYMQSSVVELSTNKRWSSRFLLPKGGDCLYADLEGRGRDLGSNDRRFFGR